MPPAHHIRVYGHIILVLAIFIQVLSYDERSSIEILHPYDEQDWHIERRLKAIEAADSSTLQTVSLVKGPRNAIFAVDNHGVRHQIPDFHTFVTLGFNITDIKKLTTQTLEDIPLGAPIKRIPAPPPFRPDDFMFHELCEEPRRLVIPFHMSQ